MNPQRELMYCKMLYIKYIIGASLSEPHINHDNGPPHGIMVCQYLCINYPAFVAAWFLRSVYALKCSVY